jgi:hypothetical protein
MPRKTLHLFGVLSLALALALAGYAPAAGAPLPKVALYSAGWSPAYNPDVIAKLTGTGMFSQVDDLSPLGCDPFPPYRGLNPTPSLATLQEYAAVLIYSDCGFYDSVALGDVLADYVDGGGHVVVATFAFWNEAGEIGIYGRLLSGGYLPLTLGTQTEYGHQYLVPDLPDDPLLEGVTSFDGGQWSFRNNAISLAPGATLVAHWTDGLPLVAYKGNVVALNFFPPSSGAREGFWDPATDGARLMANALYQGISATMEVSIDIKPGSLLNPINPWSTGTTPVAILSTADFNAPVEVDRTSLTFGRTGDENSKAYCSVLAQDVNWDGRVDLVCRFKTLSAGFKFGDTVGILKGKTKDGALFQGSDAVKILK